MCSSSEITYLETNNYMPKVFLNVKIKFCKINMIKKLRKSAPVKTEIILITFW